MTDTNLTSIYKTLSASQFNCFGIRACCPDENYAINDICRNSYDWDFADDVSGYYSNKQLNGTCAINIEFDDLSDDFDDFVTKFNNAYNLAAKYLGDKKFGKLVLIAGVDMDYGTDPQEIVISAAVVLAILKD